jgi:hypothetical protein
LTVLDLSYQVSREVGDFQHDASLAHKIFEGYLLGLIEKRHAETERQGAVAAADWAVAPLKRLKSARDYLAQFGVDGYFPDSVDELEGILGVEE